MRLCSAARWSGVHPPPSRGLRSAPRSAAGGGRGSSDRGRRSGTRRRVVERAAAAAILRLGVRSAVANTSGTSTESAAAAASAVRRRASRRRRRRDARGALRSPRPRSPTPPAGSAAHPWRPSPPAPRRRRAQIGDVWQVERYRCVDRARPARVARRRMAPARSTARARRCARRPPAPPGAAPTPSGPPPPRRRHRRSNAAARLSCSITARCSRVSPSASGARSRRAARRQRRELRRIEVAQRHDSAPRASPAAGAAAGRRRRVGRVRGAAAGARLRQFGGCAPPRGRSGAAPTAAVSSWQQNAIARISEEIIDRLSQPRRRHDEGLPAALLPRRHARAQHVPALRPASSQRINACRRAPPLPRAPRRRHPIAVVGSAPRARAHSDDVRSPRRPSRRRWSRPPRRTPPMTPDLPRRASTSPGARDAAAARPAQRAC